MTAKTNSESRSPDAAPQARPREDWHRFTVHRDGCAVGFGRVFWRESDAALCNCGLREFLQENTKPFTPADAAGTKGAAFRRQWPCGTSGSSPARLPEQCPIHGESCSGVPDAETALHSAIEAPASDSDRRTERDSSISRLSSGDIWCERADDVPLSERGEDARDGLSTVQGQRLNSSQGNTLVPSPADAAGTPTENSE
jgi:hypothetical protein